MRLSIGVTRYPAGSPLMHSVKPFLLFTFSTEGIQCALCMSSHHKDTASSCLPRRPQRLGWPAAHAWREISSGTERAARGMTITPYALGTIFGSSTTNSQR